MITWQPYTTRLQVERLSSDKAGGPRAVNTWSATGEMLSGVLARPSQRDLMRAQQQQFPLTDVLVLGAVPQDARAGDRLLAPDGLTYFVTAVEPLVQGRYCRLLLERRVGQ